MIFGNVYKNIMKNKTFILLYTLLLLLPLLGFFTYITIIPISNTNSEKNTIEFNNWLIVGYALAIVLILLTRRALRREKEIFRYRIFRELDKFIISSKTKINYIWYSIIAMIIIFWISSMILNDSLQTNALKLLFFFVIPFLGMTQAISTLFSGYQEKLSLEKIIENELKYLKEYIIKIGTIHKKLSKKELSQEDFEHYLTELNLSLYYISSYLSQWISDHSILLGNVDIQIILKEKLIISIFYDKINEFIMDIDDIKRCIGKKSQKCLFKKIIEIIENNNVHKELLKSVKIENNKLQPKKIIFEFLMLTITVVASIGISYEKIVSFIVFLVTNINSTSIFNILTVFGFLFYYGLIFVFYYKIQHFLNQIAFTKKLRRFKRK